LPPLCRAQGYTIATVAGGGLPATPASAVGASLASPVAVATDVHGNFFFTADNGVFKVDGTGKLTRVAGKSSAAGYSGDNGPAIAAQLNGPCGLAVDSSGILYIADTGNNAIRSVALNGTITTVAGNGTAGYSGDNGPAATAELNGPEGVALDGTGILYIADTENSVIRQVSGGTITTVAGTGVPGYSGDGYPATSAQLSYPLAVAVDGSHNLYIADSFNSVIREVTVADGKIATIAGDGSEGDYGDGGPPLQAEFGTPSGVALDGSGNLYIADSTDHRIRKIAGGVITTAAGDGNAGWSGDGGQASSAELNSPSDVAVYGAGSIFIADTGNNRIRAIAANLTIATVAGNGTANYAGDGGAATSALVNTPGAVAVDGSGNFYIADTYNGVIRKVTASGTITTVAGNGTFGYSGDNGPATSAQLSWPYGVALDAAGDLYIADTYNNRIRMVAPGGTITTVAGNGTRGYGGDGGLAISAELYYPHGVAVDGSGDLFIGDTGNHRVREVTASNISTVAGDGTQGYTGNGGAATSAEINAPQGVAVDSAGNLYIADTQNSAIRKVVKTTSLISTLAGTGVQGYLGDGGAATSAQLNYPTGVSLDAAGNIYVSDWGNNRLREVSASGNIWTVAGNGGSGYSGDGRPPARAQLFRPSGVAVDVFGTILVADSDNNAIRRVVPAKIATYNTGLWYMDMNNNGVWDGASVDRLSSLGWAGATYVTGDWSGNGKRKLGVFYDGYWYLDYDGNGVWDGGVNDRFYNFGFAGATPVVGDWNGDGRTKIGVFYNGFWYLDYDGNGIWDGGVNDKAYTFGWAASGMTPVLGDWNGDGRTKIGVFYDGFWYLDYVGNGVWDGGVNDKAYTFGWAASGVVPIVGDWSANGLTKIGIYYGGIWYLDYDGNGVWDGGVNDKQYVFGWTGSGVTPVLGDWSGDGRTKVGIFYNGFWYLDYDGNGTWSSGSDRLYTFGAGGGMPLIGAW
jgi:hypothetical protein